MALLILSLLLSACLGTLWLGRAALISGQVLNIAWVAGLVVFVGSTYMTLGTPDTDAALRSRIADYDKFAQQDPNNTEAYLGAARTYMQLKAYGEAKTAFERALDVSNTAPIVYREYIGAMQFAGIPITPQTPQQAILALSPDDQAAAISNMVEGLAARLNANGGTDEEWEMLARSYEALGRKEAAEAARQNIIRAD